MRPMTSLSHTDQYFTLGQAAIVAAKTSGHVELSERELSDRLAEEARREFTREDDDR